MKQIVAYSLFFSLFFVSVIGLTLVIGLVLVKDADKPRAPKPPTITYAGSAGDNLVALEDDTPQPGSRILSESAIESPTPTPAAEVHVNFPIADDTAEPLTADSAEDLRAEIIRTHRLMTLEERERLSDFVRAKSLRESQQNPTP